MDAFLLIVDMVFGWLLLIALIVVTFMVYNKTKHNGWKMMAIAFGICYLWGLPYS